MPGNLGKNNAGLNPDDLGDYDIVKNYDWTVSNQTMARAEAPRIVLTEFQQTQSALTQSINYWFNQAGDFKNKAGSVIDGFKENGITKDSLMAAKNEALSYTNDPYRGLYIAEPTDNVFTLPYYANYNHSIQNSWGENKGPLGNVVNNVIVPVAKAIMPAGGIETAKAWEGMTSTSYSLVFQLLNTIGPNIAANIEKNEKFKNVLIRSNLQYRLNSVAAVPPVIYSVEVPGIRYSPVAVISNLTVSNIGQLNYIGGRNIPDGYEFTLHITELINETRQIFDSGLPGGQKITAIIDNNQAALDLSNAQNAAFAAKERAEEKSRAS